MSHDISVSIPSIEPIVFLEWSILVELKRMAESDRNLETKNDLFFVFETQRA